MTSESDCFEGVFYQILFVVTALAKGPLVALLFRSCASREDIVSMVIVSLVVSDHGRGTDDFHNFCVQLKEFQCTYKKLITL